MLLLTFKKSDGKIYVLDKDGDILVQSAPGEFPKEFKNLPEDEMTNDVDRNEILAILAKSGFGNADCLRNHPMVPFKALHDVFIGKDDGEPIDFSHKWLKVRSRIDLVRNAFHEMGIDLDLRDLAYPTAFFVKSLISLGWKPKRNDHDWWLESGLWKVKGPMGIYYQNTIEGMTSFEPFQIKGAFKMNKISEKEFKDMPCYVYDLKNAGPCQIITKNISPETKCLEYQRYTPPLNGIWWKRGNGTLGYLPRILNKMIGLKCGKTEAFAKRMLASAIGVFGDKNCALYDVDIARSATRALRNTVRRLGTMVAKNSGGKAFWTYSDNDSVGFSMKSSCHRDIDDLTDLVKRELREIEPGFEIKLERTLNP